MTSLTPAPSLRSATPASWAGAGEVDGSHRLSVVVWEPKRFGATGAGVTKQRTADGYVRVSRRAGREGESFISPEVQRKKIADWAKLHEVEIVKWWEEIDQSGAKRERPMFQQALERCARGETGGVVVAKLDRFARSAVDALE